MSDLNVSKAPYLKAGIYKEVAAFFSDMRRYAGIIGALMVREQFSRRQNPFESFLEILEPVFLIAVTSFAWWFLDRRNQSPVGSSPVLFYSTGFFFMYFFIHLSNRMRRSIDAPISRFPVERRIDHILIHIFYKFVDYAILGCVLFGAIYVFATPLALPHDWGAISLAVLFAAMLGFGWGTVNIVIRRYWKLWAHLYPAINRGLVLFTGVIFLVDFLPPTARYVLSFIPMVHAIAMFRMGFFPNIPTMVFDMAYLTYWAFGAVAVGFVVERVSVRAE